MKHRGDGNQDAGQQPRDVTAEHSHHQAPLQAQVHGLVGIPCDDARGDAQAKDNGTDQSHLHALRERALLAHQHLGEGGAAGQDAREGSRHGQLHHQDH